MGMLSNIRRKYVVYVNDGEDVKFTEKGVRASLIAGSLIAFVLVQYGLAFLFDGRAVPTHDTIRTVIIAVITTSAYYRHSDKWLKQTEELGLLYTEEDDEYEQDD